MSILQIHHDCGSFAPRKDTIANDMIQLTGLAVPATSLATPQTEYLRREP